MTSTDPQDGGFCMRFGFKPLYTLHLSHLSCTTSISCAVASSGGQNQILCSVS